MNTDCVGRSQVLLRFAWSPRPANGLANELERLLPRRVDLVTERSVRNPYFRQVIEATRQPVYEG
jgi:predicted nucleotidyltransferase